MIDDRYVEEGIRRGLRAIAHDHAPGHLLPETFDQTRRMAQVSSIEPGAPQRVELCRSAS